MLKSPYRLIALAGGGGLLAVIGFLSLRATAGSHAWPLLAGCLLLVAAGLATMYGASLALRERVQNEHWTAETLAPIRRVTAHPAWKWVLGVLLLIMMSLLVGERHGHALFWGTFCLLQTVTQLLNALAGPRQRAASAHGVLDWSQVAPLSSEHWGERGGGMDYASTLRTTPRPPV